MRNPDHNHSSKLGTLVLIALFLVAVLAACGGALPAEVAPVSTSTPTLEPPTPTPTLPPPTGTPTPAPAAGYTPTPEPEIDTPAWFDETVLYEIFVRSFYDSDGDGVGDLAGITAQLDYLESLNVNALWLMPIHPSPSYHGYDVDDYFAVHADYGSMDDMIELVEAAHERGIRVVIDYVVNHMSRENPVFVDAFGDPESEYADWFLWFDEKHTRYQAFGGFKHMPELNHDNPEVVAYALEVARFWMDLDGDGDFSDGVDGFRCDVAKDVPLSTWSALRAEMRALNPESFLLGEVWEGGAQNLEQWYDDAFDALFDYPLYHAIAADHDKNLDSLLAGVEKPTLLNAVILGEENLFPAGYQMVRFLNNHDNNRVMSEVGGDWDRARAAATFYLTLPGTPMLYYGEEIGMPGEKGQGNPYWDEPRREPMDWYGAEKGEGMTTWFKPSRRHNTPGDGISVEEQDGVEESLLEHYRALTALRGEHRALRTGAFGKVKVGAPEGGTRPEGVYAFTRHAPPSDGEPEEWFLVVVNFSGEVQKAELELLLAYEGPFVVVDALSGEAWPEVGAREPFEVEMGAASAVVLALGLP